MLKQENPLLKPENMTSTHSGSIIALSWVAVQASLPNVAQFLRLSIQKLRLEYRDKSEMPKIWAELSGLIGRRGSLQVGNDFEVGCGVNTSFRIDPVKYPAEAAQLKALYAAPAALLKEAEAKGWTEDSAFPNLTLSVTGLQMPVEISQAEIRAMVEAMPDTKQREEITSSRFKDALTACFRFSHRRRQVKALEKKLDFMRDQALAELVHYRRDALGLEDHQSFSLQIPVDGLVESTLSVFNQPNTRLVLPDTEEAKAFKARLDAARKAPDAFLKACTANGQTEAVLAPFATLKKITKVPEGVRCK